MIDSDNLLGNPLNELMKMPIAYDMGIDFRMVRKRKSRKGSKGKSLYINTIVISSKEVAEESGNALTKIFAMKGMM